MPTAEQAYQDIVKYIEENRLEEAISALLSFAEEHSPEKVTAVRMRRSEWKALEEEALILGEPAGIRERRGAMKLQLFRLADAIRKDASAKAAAPSPSFSNDPAPALLPPYSGPRGEGPAKVFLAYAPDPGDRAGGEELRKSMALLLHLRKIEVFDQQASPAGNREAALANALNEAEAILLMLSNNFLSDLECLRIQQDAYKLYLQNRAAVIPILYNPCEWKELDIGRLQALPRNGRFITQWENDDEAYAKISREVSELTKNIRERLDYRTAPSALRASPPKGEERSESGIGKKSKHTYNTSELLALFRAGETDGLIEKLFNLTSGDPGLYDQVLLLEQRWKEISEDEKYNTASVESITIRKNQLNQSLLRLIREMGG